MMHDQDTIEEPERKGIGLAAKFLGACVLASVIILLLGAVDWWLLRSTRYAVKALLLTADGDNVSVMANSILDRINKARMTLAVCVSFGIILMAGLYVFFIRSVVKPLRQNTRLMNRLAIGDSSEDVPDNQLARNDEVGDLARAIRDFIICQRREVSIANDISAGDLTSVVTTHEPGDELGLAIQRVAGVTIETLRRVNSYVGQVMAGCEAIAAANRELSDNSTGISDATTAISSGIARIRTHADENVGIAEQAGRLSDTGSLSIERGYEDVGEMGVVMLNMQSCGDKIVRIAKSIGDISFQTSLLALNASVEAARAGRHGKGFTIVAEEVRNLAVRSSRAAEETSTLMKETVEQVELAAAIAGRINATFADLQANIQETDALLTKITEASREQSGGVEQISDAIRQVEQSSRENMDYTGGVSRNAGFLLRQTSRLRHMLGHFRFDFGRTADSELFAGSGSDTASLGVHLPPAIRPGRRSYPAGRSKN